MTKISALSDIGTGVASNDAFVLVDVSDPTTPNKKIQQQNLFLIPDGSAGTPAVRFLNDTDVGLFRPTTNTLAFATGGSERLRITSAGLVGVGSSSPGYRLDVDNTNAGTATARLVGNDQSNVRLRIQNNGLGGRAYEIVGGLNGANNSHLSIYDATAASTRLTITETGAVGIGTTSPSTSLHVQGGAGASAYATFGGNNNGSGDSFIIGQDTSGLTRLFQNSATPITFWTNAQERVRIDSSGRLLVGTSSARSNVAAISPGFQVEGLTNNSNRYAGFIYNAADVGGPEIHFAKSRGTAIGSNTVVANGDQIGTINFEGADGTNFIVGAQIRAFVDGTPGTNDMPGRLVFSTTADGASSPTERLRITSTGQVRLAGAGITFNGDTATANELDDYEEGTWTPTIAGQTTTGTGTYSVQSGRYTKVGRSVYVAGTVAWSAHDGTGNMRIAGLPFTALNVTELTNAVSFTYVSDITIPANSIPIGGVFPNSTFVTLYSMAVAGGTPNGLGMDGSGTIYFSLAYQTA